MLGDAAFDILEWHDDLIKEGTVPISPYNERNADDPHDIEYRIEQRIKEHSGTVRVWPKQLEETYEQRSQVERTIGACKDCGLERPAFRGRVCVKSHVFLTLCLWLVIAIANYERGANPGEATIEVYQRFCGSAQQHSQSAHATFDSKFFERRSTSSHYRQRSGSNIYS